MVVINPRHTCTARVTVVGSVCVTSGASVHSENDITYSTGNKGKKIVQNCSVAEIHCFLHCVALYEVSHFGTVHAYY